MWIRAIAGLWLSIVVCATGFGDDNSKPVTDHEKLVALARRLPVLDTANAACPPFDATVRWKMKGGAYVARLRFRRPDRLELLMQDAADGGPCVLYRDQIVMLFNPAKPEFVTATDHKLEFTFNAGANGKINSGARLGFGKDHSQRFVIDLAGVMQLPGNRLVDLGSTDELIRLESHREGSAYEVVELRLGEEPPTCVLRSFTDGGPEETFEITVRPHASGSEELFRKPDLEAIAKLMPVSTSSGQPDSVLAFAASMRTIGLAYYAVFSHLAAWQPDIRDEFKLPGFSTPDWDAVLLNKRELGPRLRDLFHLETPANDDDRPITPMFAAEEASSPK